MYVSVALKMWKGDVTDLLMSLAKFVLVPPLPGFQVSMYVSIALVVILLLRMAYAFYAQKCCFEAWDHKLHWLPPHPGNPHPEKVQNQCIKNCIIFL